MTAGNPLNSAKAKTAKEAFKGTPVALWMASCFASRGYVL